MNCKLVTTSFSGFTRAALKSTSFGPLEVWASGMFKWHQNFDFFPLQSTERHWSSKSDLSTLPGSQQQASRLSQSVQPPCPYRLLWIPYCNNLLGKEKQVTNDKKATRWQFTLLWALEYQAWPHLGWGPICPQELCSCCSSHSPMLSEDESDGGRDGRIVNLTSSSTSSPLAPLIATGLRLRSTWTMWQSVPPVTMLYLFALQWL